MRTLVAIAGAMIFLAPFGASAQDLANINGKREQLEGKIQQRYGLAKDMVRKNVDDWLKSQP